LPVTKSVELPSLDALVQITVGIHAAEGAEGHDGGLTNAALGEIHEFGFGVPQRSFIRAYFDENEAHISGLVEDAVIDALIEDGGKSLQLNAELVADQIVGEVKERILGRISPELAKSTRRKRGESAVPLVDSSQLLGSIRGKAETRLK
jgi:hypothetical protein